MTKQELRKLYLDKRMALSEAERLSLNRDLYSIFFSSIDLSFIRVLHTFLPLDRKKEPDTWLIIDRIRREFPNVQLSMPRVNELSGELDNYNFESLSQLKENSWGITEPVSGIQTDPKSIDIILVPLIVADQQGHRVGYGKGYYDRLLSLCRSDCQRIGLSFFPPIERIAAPEPHDQKLTAVVTPSEYFSF